MPEIEKVETLEIVCKCPGFPDVIIRKTKADEKMMINLGVKKLEDGTVVPDESNLVDLDAMVQTYKDQCGMEAAKRLLQTGEKTPPILRTLASSTMILSSRNQLRTVPMPPLLRRSKPMP